MPDGEMQEKKSPIFSLAFHHQACTTSFIPSGGILIIIETAF